MINVNNQSSGITSSPSNTFERQQGPASADVKAFERAMREQPAGERTAQARWQDNAGPLNERVRPDSGAKSSGQASTDSLFSMSGKAGAEQSRAGESARGGAMHDLETGGLRTDDPAVMAQTRGGDFIDGLFRGASGMPAMGDAAAANAAQAASMPDGEALEALVSRILVNTPEKGGSEVRLTLSDAAFRGTEVSIMRDLSGALTVKIVSSDPSAFQTLVSSRNELLSSLQAQEKAPVSVEMEEDRGGSDDANDSRRRSRGLDDLEAGGAI